MKYKKSSAFLSHEMSLSCVWATSLAFWPWSKKTVFLLPLFLLLIPCGFGFVQVHLFCLVEALYWPTRQKLTINERILSRSLFSNTTMSCIFFVSYNVIVVDMGFIIIIVIVKICPYYNICVCMFSHNNDQETLQKIYHSFNYIRLSYLWDKE